MLNTVFNRPNLTEYARLAFGSLVTVVVAIASILVTSRFVGPLPISVSQTTTEKAAAFDATGESELITVPDQAEVTVGISVRQTTVAAAQNQANTVINSISQSVQELGVTKEDIRTQNYSIYPEYNYELPTQPITGYTVNTNLQIKVKNLQNVNQVIDTATANGANQVNGVMFTLSEEKEEELTNRAREEAIADARENAQKLASLSGLKLGKVINVYEQAPYQPPVGMPFFSRDAAGGSTMEATNIEPGSTSFTYRVTLSYETL